LRELNIVDAHIHVGDWGRNLLTHGWEPRSIVRLMDRLGISRAYSMHHDWFIGRPSEARSASIRTYEESGGRIPFLVVYNPNKDTESIAIMDACLEHPGFIGVKIHPSWHGVPADDRRYDNAWAFARQNRLPIISHTWSESDNHVQRLSLPRLFEAHIDAHRDVPFVAAHCGGCGAGRAEAIRLAREYPNVYLDISGDIFSLGLLPELVESVGAVRVIFGSDQPWVDARATLTRVILSEISEDDKRLVLGENALRIFEPHLLPQESRQAPPPDLLMMMPQVRK